MGIGTSTPEPRSTILASRWFFLPRKMLFNGRIAKQLGGEIVSPIKKLGHALWTCLTSPWLLLGVVVLLAASAALFVRAVYGVRAQAENTTCRSNLHQIGIQLLSFGEIYGCLPPPFISDHAGKPLYSWRVLLLPHYGYDEAYAAFDFTKPWDDPANMRLCDGKMDIFLGHLYTCPSISRTTDTQANYFYALNAQDHWPRDFFYDANFIKSSPPHVLLVESQARSVYWSEPIDLVYQEPGLNSLLGKLRESKVPHESGFNCCLSDASVVKLPARSDPLNDLGDLSITARMPRANNDADADKIAIESLVQRWMAILGHRDRQGFVPVRHRALLLLGELGPQAKSAAPLIRQIMAEDDVGLRVIAALALAKIER